jgi:hypothetical protein
MIFGSITALAVIACDKREAFAQGSDSDEAIQTLSNGFWIASRSLSSGAHSRDPLARNDDSTSNHHALARLCGAP